MSKIWIVFALLVTGCAPQGGRDAAATVSAPPERRGPQITSREAADWSRLNAVGAIKLAKLDSTRTTRQPSGRVETDRDVASIDLKFFPQQKLITFEIVPVHNASLHCDERGQNFDLMFIASPGADVSDQLACSGQNFERYQLSMNYRTSSKLTGDTLTIDGNARVHSNDESGSADYVVSLHGVLQVSGSTCRVISWQQNFPDATIISGDTIRDDESLTSTRDTTCTVANAGG